MTDEITICFYNMFSHEISHVGTVAQKVNILSRMEESFREAVRSKPNIRNEISAVYEKLKIQCDMAS